MIAADVVDAATGGGGPWGAITVLITTLGAVLVVALQLRANARKVDTVTERVGEPNGHGDLSAMLAKVIDGLGEVRGEMRSTLNAHDNRISRLERLERRTHTGDPHEDS